MKEEGKPLEVNYSSAPELESTAKDAVHVPTKEEVRRRAKQAANELANYKRRLRESVDLKRLQVEEIELNIRYHNAREEYKDILEIVAKEEAAEQEATAKENKALDIEIAHKGKRRSAEEIEQAKELLK